ncbi:MAG: riboflavin kinase [Alistipes sp.]
MDEHIVVEGVVIHGRELGRKIGYPTANIEVNLNAPSGVWVARIVIDNKAYAAMANIGKNPTVGGLHRHLEVHIFGFNGDLYGHYLRIELVRKIRKEQRFSTIDELKAQLDQDKEMLQPFIDHIC